VGVNRDHKGAMKHSMPYGRRQGFTLVEVSLAVLVVGLGLLSVFSLFPAGLRSAEDDTADTRSGLFAETVMNGLRGNAAAIATWTDWENNFASTVVRDVLGSGRDVVANGNIVETQFPTGGDWLRYRLSLNVTDPNCNSARLEVCDGRYGPFDGVRVVIYTEFTFTGTQP
jgi:prepilin-type N-terminal cleavage/methylation domain-containing protein